MTIRRKNKQVTPLDPKRELLAVLHPLRRVAWVNKFIKKIQQPQTNLPTGKNANTERFILALSLCLCLFVKNHSSLMRYGNQLKNYTNKYAVEVPTTEASFINSKIDELLQKFSNKSI